MSLCWHVGEMTICQTFLHTVKQHTEERAAPLHINMWGYYVEVIKPIFKKIIAQKHIACFRSLSVHLWPLVALPQSPVSAFVVINARIIKCQLERDDIPSIQLWLSKTTTTKSVHELFVYHFVLQTGHLYNYVDIIYSIVERISQLTI